MSNISKRRKEGSRSKIKSMGDHKDFLKRITKTLYYGQLPSLPCLSLPVTEVSCEVWSVSQRGRSVRRLHADCAARVSRAACVSPAALVLALLYMERLRTAAPRYLAHTAPADLFLVTLMVGNKFLQDDGEDEEVVCAEWAACGGLQLPELKRHEIQFLHAIDWNVFVNDESFELGLRWLERRVALRQAQLRGFFTYSDLVCASEGVAAAWGAGLTGLLALLASALVVTACCLPPHCLLSAPARTSVALDARLAPPAFPPPLSLPQYVPNSTELPPPPPPAPQRPACCPEWARHRQHAAPKKSWYEAVVASEWNALEPWWSRTSLVGWLHQSSLVDPLRRWLERVNEYTDLFRRDLAHAERPVDRCRYYDDGITYSDQQKCVRQWLNLSKLSALVVSVSDR